MARIETLDRLAGLIEPGDRRGHWLAKPLPRERHPARLDFRSAAHAGTQEIRPVVQTHFGDEDILVITQFRSRLHSPQCCGETLPGSTIESNGDG